MSSESESRLREILASVAQSSESSVSDFISFLNSVSDSARSDPDDAEAKSNAFRALSQVLEFISSPTLAEETADALAFELPSAAARLGCVSAECSEIAGDVIDRFVSMCNPRDMLSILCEAVAYSGDMVNGGSGYYVPLLKGISKAFISIRRRPFEQVKTAVPVVLNVLKAITLQQNDENTDLKDIFNGSLIVANSIKQVCTESEASVSEKLRAVLGLYVLQIMAIASFDKNYQNSSSQLIVTQLSSLLPYCGLSYLSLITGTDVDRLTGIAVGENEEDFKSCLPYVKLGASLSVIWGYINDTAVEAAKEDLISVEDELKKDQTKRWQAIGMLKHVLSSLYLPWKLKKHAISILLCITDGNVSKNCDDEDSEYMPSVFAALQAIQTVIMFAPDIELRRNAFDAFKKILADLHSSQRFDILKALIINSDSSSMVAILFDILRKELHTENCQRTRAEKADTTDGENKAFQPTSFWSSSVLELVELVLRPPKGGPPDLPEHSDSVLSALNLYRFVLLTESAAKTNHTEVLSKSNLQKALNEWLLPLRTLVTGIMAENNGDCDQFAVDTICAINPMELVLYRCIELVEEKLKQSS